MDSLGNIWAVVEQNIVEDKIVEPDTYYDCLNLSNSWEDFDTEKCACIVLDRGCSRVGLKGNDSYMLCFEVEVDGVHDSFLFFSHELESVASLRTYNREEAFVLFFDQSYCQPNGSASCFVVWKHSQKWSPICYLQPRLQKKRHCFRYLLRKKTFYRPQNFISFSARASCCGPYLWY